MNMIFGAVAAAFAFFFLSQKANAGPRIVTTIAGARYRFSLVASPKLADTDVMKLQAAVTLTGATNFSVVQSDQTTNIHYETAVPTGGSYTLGSQITVGGVTLTLADIEEIKP